MSRLKHVLHDIFFLAREQFWPFILFWLAVLVMRFYPLGGLLSLTFLNSEAAVRFWVKHGYSYKISFFACIACANFDLAVWFLFFRRGRLILEHRYPRAWTWLVKKFDQGQQGSNQNYNGNNSLRLIAARLNQIFTKQKHRGLFLIGFTPVCSIFVGVPLAVGYKVKHGYLMMALGNTLKIIVFGFIFMHNATLVGFFVVLAAWILLLKRKPRNGD